MPKISRSIPIAAIPLDASSAVPMYRQIYFGLQHAILSGAMRSATRLPSTRVLASELGVSRNTVTLAFEMLLAEGYLQGKVGSGTYVAAMLPEESLWKRAQISQPTSAISQTFSKRGKVLSEIRIGSPAKTGPVPVPFRAGLPALDAFPVDAWLRLVTRKTRELIHGFLTGYGNAAGYLPLREAIAEYLAGARAVRCKPSQVIIVSGSQHALDIIARVLTDPKDEAWIEDPGYVGSRAALLSAGLNVLPVPVNSEGMDLEYAKRKYKRPQLIYVTPSHQFPLGMTMSVSRRMALLEFAEHSHSWIIEDDYDSEYRYSGHPLSSLQGLDRGGRVLYVGTFSKVLFPALRLGYVVVPEHLVDGFTAARAIIDRHSPTIEQAVLAEFIREGEFTRHIRRMRVLYAQRQVELLKAMKQHLPQFLKLEPSDAGMHLVAWMPEDVDILHALELAAQAGVDLAPLDYYSIRKQKRKGVLLGYTAWNAQQIHAAAGKLAKAWKIIL